VPAIAISAQGNIRAHFRYRGPAGDSSCQVSSFWQLDEKVFADGKCLTALTAASPLLEMAELIAMRFSRSIAYAIDTTLRIARQHSACPIPCKLLAKESGLPERFLLQVLRPLVRSGVLRSSRGTKGGYRLARQPNQISILQIVQSFDNPLQTRLPITHGVHFVERKLLLAALRSASDAAGDRLGRVTIADLMVEATTVDRQP
jgi:Rrf2 family protein